MGGDRGRLHGVVGVLRVRGVGVLAVKEFVWWLGVTVADVVGLVWSGVVKVWRTIHPAC